MIRMVARALMLHREKECRVTQDILAIHGGWHGSWVWTKLTPLLIAQGFRVHTPTLVGMGETATVYRHHPYSKLGVSDHVRQIEEYIRLNGLEQPYLVGHSYAGAVLNGVLNDMGHQIRGALFLDALFFTPGVDFAHLIAIKHPPAWCSHKIKSGTHPFCRCQLDPPSLG